MPIMKTQKKDSWIHQVGGRRRERMRVTRSDGGFSFNHPSPSLFTHCDDRWCITMAILLGISQDLSWCWVQILIYRVTHHVGSNLPLTSKQKFRFGLAKWPCTFLCFLPPQQICNDFWLSLTHLADWACPSWASCPACSSRGGRSGRCRCSSRWWSSWSGSRAAPPEKRMGSLVAVRIMIDSNSSLSSEFVAG